MWKIENRIHNRADCTVDTHIKMLRAKLGNAGNYIKSIRGNGYIFEADIK